MNDAEFEGGEELCERMDQAICDAHGPDVRCFAYVDVCNVLGLCKRLLKLNKHVPAAKDIAQEVLDVFDLQREYFRTRDKDKLKECKEAESLLRNTCKEIINPPKAKEPELFGYAAGPDEPGSPY